MSNGHRPGLLDLPPEIRIMIFRHLLLSSHDLCPYVWPLEPQKSLGILSTNKLIYEEAFEILCGENTFADPFWAANATATSLSARAFKSIRDIHSSAMIKKDDPGHNTANNETFVNLIRHFGNSSIIRGTLSVQFYVNGLSLTHLLNWYIGALGQFTNFRTVNLYFDDRMFDHARDSVFLLEHLRTGLEPVLGPAERYEIVMEGRWGYKKRGLRFHRREVDPLDLAADVNVEGDSKDED